MRLKQVSLIEATGKTIRTTYHSCNDLVIVFDDDTYISFETCDDYGGLMIAENEIKIGSLPDKYVIELGFYTKDDIDAYRADLEKKQAQQNRERDMRELENIKKRLGITDS